MAGLFGVGGSGNTTDRNRQLDNWGALSTVGGWAQPFGQSNASTGSSDLTSAGNFFQTLLSGNPVATSQVLSPEISTVQNQTQQKLDTTSEFNNRSGGTAEELVKTGDTSTASIQQLIASLLPQSANGLAQVGQAQAGIGLTAEEIASNAFATISGQAGGDRAAVAAPLQQAQQGAILNTLINTNIPGTGGNSLNDILGL